MQSSWCPPWLTDPHTASTVQSLCASSVSPAVCLDPLLLTGLSWPVGAGQVIQGWDDGIKGMCLNEKRTLTIPAHLAYGLSPCCTPLSSSHRMLRFSRCRQRNPP